MLAGPKIVTHDEVVAMVVWNPGTGKNRRFEIKDIKGKVVSVCFMKGRKVCFERPGERKRRRGA
jgi:hypothetical protein